MKRPVRRELRCLTLASALCMLSMQALGQPVDVFSEAPRSVIEDLETIERIDGIRLWVVDWDGDEWSGLITQTAFNPSGNSYFFVYHVFLGTGEGHGKVGGFVRSETLELNGAIRTIEALHDGFRFTLAVHQGGDANCCPTGVEVTEIHP